MESYNTTFVSNSNRGALLIENARGIIVISQCQFASNRARCRGGAIYTSGSTIIIHNSTFSSNTVGYSWYSSCAGGAIYAIGINTSLVIQQSRFMNNHVSGNNGNGGAICVSGANSSLSINQSKFMSNRLNRGGNGGALYMNGDNSSLSIYQSMIGKNSIQLRAGSGSAVCLIGGNSRILIEQSSFSKNNALTGSSGAIYTNGLSTYILISESIINNNLATKCGALDINNLRHYNVKFKDSEFISNSAIIKSGGVMCIRDASISVQNVTFSHNRAAENAGVFAVDDSEMTIQDSTFDNNTAGANGGVLHTEYFRTSLFISHASFTNNQAVKQGGVMYLGRKGSQVKISRSVIRSNNATKGGLATLLGSSLEITTSNILNNTAEAGEVVSACNSNISVSDQLSTSTDPIYSVCTLIGGNVNENDLDVITTTKALLDTTMTTGIPPTTSRPTPAETTTMGPTISLPTELASIISSVYFELNGIAYPNNSVISLSEVGENEHALLCKTDLVPCCGTLPNRFGEFYYPNGDTVSVKGLGHGFYRDRGAQMVCLNRREGVTSPTGKFRCAIPDASGTMRYLFVHLLNDVISNEQK